MSAHHILRSGLAAAEQAVLKGEVSSTEILESALSAVHAPEGQGDRIFTQVYAKTAMDAARLSDSRRSPSEDNRPLLGLPISIKDLFDVADEPTLCGSRVLQDAPPARADAAIVSALKAAGAAVIGKTNMTEFAFSGLGLNPHYGTPVFTRESGRATIPGGSSSRAVMSVVEGMAVAAIGSDTGGSARIPAAFCGLTGFKPTQARYSRRGMAPLSTTLDCVGTLARTVDDCIRLDAVLSDQPWTSTPANGRVRNLRVGVVSNMVCDELEPLIARSFENALNMLALNGALIFDHRLHCLDLLADINRVATFPAAESYTRHAELLAQSENQFDPRVSSRMLNGRHVDAQEYARMKDLRAKFMASYENEAGEFDILVMPTTPVSAPQLSDLASDKDYFRLNTLALRNPSIANLADACAISIPCPRLGDEPVGFMAMARQGQDQALLTIARNIETVFRGG